MDLIKMLFFVLVIVHQYIAIIEKKVILVLGKCGTDVLQQEQRLNILLITLSEEIKFV